MTNLKGRITCGLFAALFVASSIVSYTGYSASAQIPDDDAVRTVDELYIVSGSYRQNISTSYLSIINQNRFGNCSGFESTITQAFDTGDYAISQKKVADQDSESVLIYVTPTNTNDETSLEFVTNSLPTGIRNSVEFKQPIPSGSITAEIYLNQQLEPVASCSNGLAPGVITSDPYNPNQQCTEESCFPNPDISVYLSTYNVVYPDGYTGIYIPQSGGGSGGGLETIRPDFSYEVNNKDLSATDHQKTLPTFEPDEGYNIVNYQTEWTLYKCDNFDDNICENGSLKNTEIINQTDNYKYSVDEYGKYELRAQYLVQQCFRYDSYPATPDYCFYVDLGTEVPEYDFTSTSVFLDINGNNISGDTRDQECDVSGLCQPKSIYEDCSLKNINIQFWSGGPEISIITVDTVICMAQNVGKWVLNFIKFIFVPSQSFMVREVEGFGTWLSDKFGFIADSFDFVLELAKATLSINAQPVLTIPGNPTFFGGTFSVDFSKMEQSVPTIWNIMMTLVRSIILVGILFAANHRFWGVIRGLGK